MAGRPADPRRLWVPCVRTLQPRVGKRNLRAFQLIDAPAGNPGLRHRLHSESIIQQAPTLTKHMQSRMSVGFSTKNPDEDSCAPRNEEKREWWQHGFNFHSGEERQARAEQSKEEKSSAERPTRTKLGNRSDSTISPCSSSGYRLRSITTKSFRRCRSLGG